MDKKIKKEKVKKMVEKHYVFLFFFFSAFLGYLPWMLSGEPQWFLLGMPITGITLTAIVRGKAGIIAQLKNAVNIKTKFTYYIEIICILVGLNCLTLLISYMLFGDVPSFAFIREQPHMIPLAMLLILLGGPILEEVFGLRGVALPELLKRRSPLIATLLVGAFYGAWHLPEFLRAGSTQYPMGLTAYPFFIISLISYSVIMTWFYIRSKGRLFLSGIFFHWMNNCLVVLFLTDITYDNILDAPPMNMNYFYIDVILVTIIATIIVFTNKFYKKEKYKWIAENEEST